MMTIAAILVPLLVFWLDIRHHQGQNARRIEERASIIEAKIDPIINYWNEGRKI